MPPKQCLMPVRQPATPVPEPTTVALNIAMVPRGDGPATARDIADTWQFIDPDESIWFKMGEGIDPEHLDVWLDVHGNSGITFVVYAPDQMGDWSPVTKPKGAGAFNRFEVDHDLRWSGQAAAGGTWYVVVHNANPAPIEYKLGYNRVVTPRKSCDSYNEFIGSWYGSWTACH